MKIVNFTTVDSRPFESICLDDEQQTSDAKENMYS